MLNQTNTKKQGDVGLGAAIAYFTANGYTVSIPLTDSQDYDLVVDYEGVLRRVQIKTTRYKRNNGYHVSLTVKGGNQTFTTIKAFDRTKADLLFILDADGNKYLIPTSELVCKSHVVLNSYEAYKIRE